MADSVNGLSVFVLSLSQNIRERKGTVTVFTYPPAGHRNPILRPFTFPISSWPSCEECEFAVRAMFVQVSQSQARPCSLASSCTHMKCMFNTKKTRTNCHITDRTKFTPSHQTRHRQRRNELSISPTQSHESVRYFKPANFIELSWSTDGRA